MNTDQIRPYLALTITDPEALDAAEAKLRARLRAGQRDLADYVVSETDGVVTAGVRVQQLNDHLTLLVGPVLHPTLPTPPSALTAMIAAAFESACSKQTAQIGIRTLSTVDSPALSAALTAAGFSDCGTRIEYRSPVAALPDDTGTPLTWSDLDEVGEDQAAAMLARASQGDPHGLGPDDDPAAIIAGYRSEADLSSGPDCIQIGALGGEPVAFVCAQVAADGWARITYMGLVPTARGQGLGAWVHRRGFTMLAAQGGTLYHGGTAGENTAMVRLFQLHGCTELRRMTEWEWIRPAPV